MWREEQVHHHALWRYYMLDKQSWHVNVGPTCAVVCLNSGAEAVKRDGRLSCGHQGTLSPNLREGRGSDVRREE